VTAKASKCHASKWRILIGSSLGALYAVVIFFPAFEIYYTAIAKFIFSMLLVAVTYNIERVSRFIKVLSILYVVSFIFGGAALALFYFTNVGAFLGIFLSNGVIYFNFPWKMLVISGIIAYIVIRVSSFAIQARINKRNMYIPLNIIFDNKGINVNALIDTGNSLYDPISHLPVIIVEFQAIRDLLPNDVQGIFEKYNDDNLGLVSTIMSNSIWLSRFRLIPFTSLGKENGMLIGFKPDEVEIIEDDGKKDLKDIIIGIYNKRLSNNENYKALLHPELIG
jgi:stage II sporulation protein GA (sporulation sigma-E factor processing peptidase)